MQYENMGAGIINPFPGQATEWVDYTEGSGNSDDPNHSDVRGFTSDPHLATAVTSVVRDQLMPGTTPFAETMHKLVLDLDHDAKLVPSSTPGHHHLFIDKAMRWDQLVRLLCVLAEVGLVEPGYVSACIDQGRTSVRLPHVKRDVPRSGAGAVFTEPVLNEDAPALPLPPGAEAPPAFMLPAHLRMDSHLSSMLGRPDLREIPDVTGIDRAALERIELQRANNPFRRS